MFLGMWLMVWNWVSPKCFLNYRGFIIDVESGIALKID